MAPEIDPVYKRIQRERNEAQEANQAKDREIRRLEETAEQDHEAIEALSKRPISDPKTLLFSLATIVAVALAIYFGYSVHANNNNNNHNHSHHDAMNDGWEVIKARLLNHAVLPPNAETLVASSVFNSLSEMQETFVSDDFRSLVSELVPPATVADLVSQSNALVLAGGQTTAWWHRVMEYVKYNTEGLSRDPSKAKDMSGQLIKFLVQEIGDLSSHVDSNVTSPARSMLATSKDARDAIRDAYKVRRKNCAIESTPDILRMAGQALLRLQMPASFIEKQCNLMHSAEDAFDILERHICIQYINIDALDAYAHALAGDLTQSLEAMGASNDAHESAAFFVMVNVLNGLDQYNINDAVLRQATQLSVHKPCFAL